MAIKKKVYCDLTEKELDNQSQERMTVVSVVYKKMKTINHKGKNVDIIASVEPYEIHICAEKATDFMNELQKILNNLKE